MRKGRDGGKRGEKNGKKKEKTDENSGHYVVASNRPLERRPLERRTLAPITNKASMLVYLASSWSKLGPAQPQLVLQVNQDKENMKLVDQIWISYGL